MKGRRKGQKGQDDENQSFIRRCFNPFADSLRASLDALAASDPSMTREAQGGCRHGVSGDRAVQCDHAALS